MSNVFTDDELACKCCGVNGMKHETISRLESLRTRVGDFEISSAFRCSAYNEKIGATQTHASGQAVDILCRHNQAYEILKHALHVGFTGIGISQKGAHHSRFIHIDDLVTGAGVYRPTIWSY